MKKILLVDDEPGFQKIAGLRLKKDDVVAWQLAGGGGYGDPLQRDPARVQRDVRMGYVTMEGARRDYGVVLHTDMSIDEDATRLLRSGRAA